MDIVNPWDTEYEQQGIPSSYKSDPSSSVRWFIDNLVHIDATYAIDGALDIGCGAGRNSLFLAENGMNVVGIDRSSVAIERAKQAASESSFPATFLHHDLNDGLPFEAASQGAAIDTFVFFHLERTAQRTAYLEELLRVLRPGGFLLLTLATTGDGYYGRCPEVSNWREWSDIKIVLDEEIGVSNSLFTEPEFLDFVGRYFDLEMTSRKRMTNVMHGKPYRRETLCTIWRRPENAETDPRS
jgi:SAM-dependent methyltransferase